MILSLRIKPSLTFASREAIPTQHVRSKCYLDSPLRKACSLSNSGALCIAVEILLRQSATRTCWLEYGLWLSSQSSDLFCQVNQADVPRKDSIPQSRFVPTFSPLYVLKRRVSGNRKLNQLYVDKVVVAGGGRPKLFAASYCY